MPSGLLLPMPDFHMQPDYRPILPRFRSRCGNVLQLLALAGMVFQPLALQSSWVDTDFDSTWDAWQDPSTSATTSLVDLDVQSSDIDGDNATNEEERDHGSDPFVFDTDGDGLSDGDEIHLAIEGQAKSYSLNAWDSDGDFISDFDDFHISSTSAVPGFTGMVYAGGVLPEFANASYSDYDGDGIKNPFDPHPGDPYNNDADQDGIDDAIDPVPGDNVNYGANNGVGWYSDAIGDIDADGILNFYDSSPNGDGSSGGGAANDTDADGLSDDVDPAPNDSTNYSPHNGINWAGDVLGDADSDGTLNFFDVHPHGSGQDSDSDGLTDDIDPAVHDSTNYSSINDTAWYSDALSDADSDGTVNFSDALPHGWVDADVDGFSDSVDPAPNDAGNYSPINGVGWGSDALGDADGDGQANFYDPDPYGAPPPPDSDGDGLNADDEAYWGTRDDDPDSDDDGLTDYEEVQVHGSSPTNKFSLSQASGRGSLYTDWQLVDQTDTDGDTIPDRVEQHYSNYGLSETDPLDALRDIDHNGLSNLTQYQMGIALDADMQRYDADGDGMTDVFEDHHQLNKHDFNDAVEDPDQDGVTNHEEQALVLDPRNPDTAGSGGPLGDLLQLMLSVAYPGGETPSGQDEDENGIPDWADGMRESGATSAGPCRFVRASAGDLDGDGMSDVWEHRYGRHLYLQNGLSLRNPNDAGGDPDHDHLSSLNEFRFDSNPLVRQTLPGEDDHQRFHERPGTQATGGLLNRYRATIAAESPKGLIKDFRLWEEPNSNGGGSTGGGGSGGNPKPGSCGKNTTNCPDCNGNGRVACPECGGQMPNCPDCLNGLTRCGCFNGQCYSCNGTGISTEVACTSCGQSCQSCGGSRIVGYACATCGGDSTTDCSACSNQRYFNGPCEACANCSVCGGDGVQPGNGACQTCSGTGLCSSCSGLMTGSPCGACAGSGKKPKTCSVCDADFKINCNRCAGSGKDTTCACGVTGCTCFGTGTHCTANGGGGSGTGGGGSGSGGDDSTVVSSSMTTAIGSVTGQKHRKVGLNGVPMPDSKPQDQDESGEAPEETYIDAFSLQLRHSVTDVYVPAEGSLLTLNVRRDLCQETWSRRHGLRPQERPDQPFGPGWTSNLCSYARFDQIKSENSTTDGRITLVDEQGQSQVFYSSRGEWIRGMDDVRDPKNWCDRLEASSPMTSLVLRKKFGSTCYYQMVSMLPIGIYPDRINRQGPQPDSIYFYRLTRVTDRWGNQLLYEYPSMPASTPDDEKYDTLIPSRIHDPARPGHAIQITQANGRVMSVTSPDGSVISYGYNNMTVGTEELLLTGNPHPDRRQDSFMVLGSVVRGGSSVHYQYDVQEIENHNWPPREDGAQLFTRHLALNRIEDELGNVHQFSWTPDYSLRHDISPALLSDTGVDSQPMMLCGVTRPDLSVVRVIGSRHASGSGPLLSSQGGYQFVTPDVINVFVGGEGAYTFAFSSPMVDCPAMRLEQGADDDVTNLAAVVQYLKSSIYQGVPPWAAAALNTGFGIGADLQALIDGGAGSELVAELTFNPNACMAVDTARDLSGNVTKFAYEDPAPVSEGSLFVRRLGSQFYDDPTSETEAFGTPQARTRSFTYDPATRILTSTTDGRGNSTVYEVDFKGRRVSETLDGPGGGGRRTDYFFNDVKFPGRMTSKVERSLTTGFLPSPPTVTVYDQGEPEMVGGAPQNPGYWREKTEAIGEGTLQGVLTRLITSTTTIEDFAGRKRQIIDPNGNVTSFDYDTSGRLTQVVHPDGSQKSLQYDPHGNLVRETDESGLTTFHEYDIFHRRVKSVVDLNQNAAMDPGYADQVADPATGMPVYNGDIVTTTTYNARGQVLSQADPRGKVTTHSYDSHGRLVSTDDGGHLTAYEYGANSGGSVFDTSSFKPVRITDPRGLVTTFTYDSLYRQITSSTPLGGTTTQAFDAANNLISVTDCLGRVTTRQYDCQGRCTKTTFPDNASVQQFHDHHGKVWKSIDEAGTTTLLSQDAAGRPIIKTVNVPEGMQQPVTYTEYDPAGNVVKVTDPLGRAAYTTYDNRNRPVSVHAARVWDSVGGAFVWPETLTTYDASGRVLSVTDHTGATVQNVYDAAGRLWKTTDPLGHVTVRTLDANGNVLTTTDPLGRKTTNTYSAHNLLLSTTDEAGIVNVFEYDAVGNRTRVVDGLGQQTVFAYDLLNRLTSQVFANGDTWSHDYDSLHKVSQTSPKGVTTLYSYDARDRLLTSSAPGIVRTHVYDLCGRLLQVTEAGRPQAAVSYTYDCLGRLGTESSRGLTHEYFYDLCGNRVRAELGTGQVVETSYDALNRPETISQGGRLTRYGYDLAGRAVMLIAGNGQVTENAYDAAGRLVNRVMFRSLQRRTENDVMAEFGWAHDAAGNVVAQHEVWPGVAQRSTGVRVTTMTYDNAGRLETETVADPEQGTAVTSYAYDAANNRVGKAVQGGAEPGIWDYAYNAANQLTSWRKRDGTGAVLLKEAALSYDANGNRSEQTVTDLTTSLAAVTSYAWDAQDRLSAVVMPDGGVHGYEYDYRTRRIGITRAGGGQADQGTTVVFSGGLSLAEWESTASTEPPSTIADPTSPIVEYHRGPDMGGGVGGLLYSLRGSTLKYNLSNGRGDVVAQSNAAGEVTWTASYEAYGKRTKETGANADKQRANSKDEDPTGLLNEGFRYRDLETGVWLSRDPAGFVDGPNLYAYVKQNPWTGFDPLGLAEESVVVKAIKERSALVAQTYENAGRQDGANAQRAKFERGQAAASAMAGGMNEFVSNTPIGAANEAFTGVNAMGDPLSAGERLAVLAGFVPAGKFVGRLGKAGVDALSSSAQEISKKADEIVDAIRKGGDGAAKSGGTTSKAARREAMRQKGIPTSQQPVSQSKNASGREYQYETPKPGGGSQTKSVQQQTMDNSHPGQGHWEAGTVKTDPVTGEIRMNNYGRPKLQNDKSKVDYDD